MAPPQKSTTLCWTHRENFAPPVKTSQQPKLTMITPPVRFVVFFAEDVILDLDNSKMTPKDFFWLSSI